MYTTPILRVVTASALLLIISGCSNHPRKSYPEANSKVSYDYSKRQKFKQKVYVNRYENAFLKARRQQTPQAQVRLASYNPQQIARQEQLRQQRMRQLQLKLRLRQLEQQRKQHNSRQHPTSLAWQQLHQGFRIPNYNHQPKVRRYVNSYAKMPERMQELSNRAAPYLPSVVQEVRRRNMPSEIALLPFVESAYNTHAYSPAHAAGMWQFIPATARRYGLNVSKRHDERYNWRSSTNAALSYLQDLNRQFNGDWLLTLAAYNCGEARVAREIARNRARGLPTDYWNLNLPRETRNYVPKLLAFKEVFGNPRGLGMNIAHIPHNPRFEQTQYKPSAQQYIAKANAPIRRKVVTHKVKSGDTLYRIAQKYNTSVRTIMNINKLKSTRINSGEKLIIASSGIGQRFG